MSLSEFKDQNPDQLKQLLGQLRQQLLDLRVQKTTQKVKDVSQFRKLRKDVARILTLLQKQEPAVR